MTFTTKTIFNSLLKDGILKIGRALDIGGREGKDAINFVKEGYIVDVLDSDTESIKSIPTNPSITPILSKIEDFKIEKETYDLISCQYVLHFLSKEVTEDVIVRMIEGTKSGGVVAFTLLGDKDEWKNIIPRTGRFVDMENDYTTMDPSFMESVWWSFGELWKKGLVYEGFQSMHISPLLETPLSNFEVGQNYKDITDISVYVKFKSLTDEDTYFIAWTTTPWTLPGNVALAVGNEINYSVIEVKNTDTGNYKIIVANDRIEHVLKGKEYSVIETKPTFNFLNSSKALSKWVTERAYRLKL